MPFVERDPDTHAVKGCYANAQEGYAEEFLADDDADVVAYRTPAPVSHLNGGMLIRFTATNPITIFENLGLAGVSRLAKGRYRITHTAPMPTSSYSVFPDLLDLADKRIRVTARTVDFVEVRIVDAAGTAADATEASVKIERVITP